MTERLSELYHSFYKRSEYQELKQSVDENHKLLSSHICKEDRKCVLRIIDAMEMICNYQNKNSFIQGIKLGVELTTELQSYDVWVPIISLTREDATATVYDNFENWQILMSKLAPKMAENFKIKLDNFHWYAAFHN